jgi:hypothetical protein
MVSRHGEIVSRHGEIFFSCMSLKRFRTLHLNVSSYYFIVHSVGLLLT